IDHDVAETVPDAFVLENDLVCYEFSENGEVLSAYDKEEGRSILRGMGNQLSLYIDKPVNDDAWDIDLYYRKQRVGTAQGLHAEKISCGKLRSTLRFELKIGNSTVLQAVSLESRSKRLDFHNLVDWNESHRMLRVSFETAILADEAAFDIQYGFVKRPTHANTLSDMAKFEAAGQRYADISESTYGVALLNDCKYGYYVKNGTLDLGLLRSPKYPDWNADICKHEFSYALLPHRGSLTASDVMRESACFNRIPFCLPGYVSGAIEPPCRIEGDGITLEAIKKAEKGNNVIVRIVENLGTCNCATLVLRDPKAEIVETNLIEWGEGIHFTPKDGRIEIKFSPFEIKTLRICSCH
ncbi:MAG: glycoside hydrolase family 38 C-terminal domain-containing protein, partial [Lentisphaerota bacterium]